MRFFLASLICFILITQPLAQQAKPCGPQKGISERLAGKYKEQVFFKGVSTNGKALFTVWVSKKGTFTITRTSSLGLTCIIGAGRNWVPLKLKFDETSL